MGIRVSSPYGLGTSVSIRRWIRTSPPVSERSAPEAPASVPASGSRPHPARRLLIGAVTAALAALLIAAAVGGWWLANVTLIASNNAAAAAVPTPGAVEVDTTGLVQMPDVRGLELATALQVLADSDIPADAITTRETPSVATKGTVVEQTPAFGTTGFTSIELTVAVPATMPALEGASRDDAVAALSALGTGVEVTYSYSKDATPGVVLSTTPGRGEPLGRTAALVISTAGSTIPLSEVPELRGRCQSRSEVAIDGRDYTTVLLCESDSTQVTDTTWMLSQSADRFTATVGIPDTGTPGTSVGFTVLLDGVVAAEGIARFGSSVPVDVACTGATQITIRVNPTTDEGVDIAFGAAVLYGSEDGIARLGAL